MPVNLTPPVAAQLLPVAGVSLGIAEANIKRPNRKDLLVMQLSEGARVAGVFTKNRFCAAPVIVAREHLAQAAVTGSAGIRALLVNTGNANAGTGEQGMQDARTSCAALAGLLGCKANQILPFSTGVIMEPLPVAKIAAGLPGAVANMRADNWLAAAEAIMTTDIVAKAISKQVNDRRCDRHDHRHRQGLRHDPSRTWRRCWATSPPMRRSRNRCCRRWSARPPTARSTASPWTATLPPTTR